MPSPVGCPDWISSDLDVWLYLPDLIIYGGFLLSLLCKDGQAHGPA